MKMNPYLFTLTFAAFAFYCGSSKDAVKKAPTSQEAAKKQAQEQATATKRSAAAELDKATAGLQATAIVDAMNSRLADLPLSGFPFAKSQVDVNKYRQWARLAAPVVTEILKKVPPGYIFQIRGHADAKGSESRNLQISRERAAFVRNQLAKEGVNSSKIQIKGVGASEPANPSNPEAAENRRVTFHVVKK